MKSVVNIVETYKLFFERTLPLSWICLLVLLSSFATQAKTLSYKELLKMAEQKDLAVQIAKENLSMAQQVQAQSGSSFWPQLSLQASGSDSSVQEVHSQTYSTGLSLTQNLWNGGQDFSRWKISQKNEEIARWNLKADLLRLSAEFKSAVENFRVATKMVQLTKLIVKRRQEHQKIVELRFQSGLENKGSVLLSQANVSSAQWQWEQAVVEMKNAEKSLKALIGWQDQGSENDEPLQLEEFSTLQPIKFTSLKVESIFDQVPQLKVSELQKQIAQIDKESVYGRFLPKVDLSLSTGFSDTQFFPQTSRSSIGLSLSVPLFDGMKDVYELKVKTHQERIQKLTWEMTSQKVRDQIEAAYDDWKQSCRKEDVDLEFRSAAEVRAEIARKKYNNGLMSFEEWDQVESDLIARQTGFLQSQKNRIAKEVIWDQTSGQGVFL
jgi:outer membrane protein